MKVAIVTGASGGIGTQVCWNLLTRVIIYVRFITAINPLHLN